MYASNVCLKQRRREGSRRPSSAGSHPALRPLPDLLWLGEVNTRMNSNSNDRNDGSRIDGRQIRTLTLTCYKQ